MGRGNAGNSFPLRNDHLPCLSPCCMRTHAAAETRSRGKRLSDGEPWLCDDTVIIMRWWLFCDGTINERPVTEPGPSVCPLRDQLHLMTLYLISTSTRLQFYTSSTLDTLQPRTNGMASDHRYPACLCASKSFIYRQLKLMTIQSRPCVGRVSLTSIVWWVYLEVKLTSKV